MGLSECFLSSPFAFIGTDFGVDVTGTGSLTGRVRPACKKKQKM